MRARWDGKRAKHSVPAMCCALGACQRMLVAALAVAAATLAASAPAQALEQHALAGVFGKAFEASSGGSLSRPAAVAINEASGDVYVLDKGNDRVVRFGADHDLIETWGFGVSNASKEYERCHAGESCLPGLAGFGHGQFDEPDAIAVDNASGSPSRGDVYVVANSTKKKAQVYKFTPEGELIQALRLTNSEAEGPVDGVAVDGTGVVWVEREDEGEGIQILRFSSAEKGKLLGEPAELEVPGEDEEGGTTFEGARPIRPGFALDSKGDLYVTYAPGGLDSEEIEEEQATLKKKESPIEDLGHPCEVHTCLVAKIPVVVAGESGEETVEEAEPESPEAAVAATAEVDSESATGVAVDNSTGMELSQDAFVDNIDSVSGFTAKGAQTERFGSEELQAAGGGSGLTVDGKTNELLLANALSGQVEAYAYQPKQPGPPVIERGSVFPAKVSATQAQARAMTDPNGAATSYRVQYGEVECSSHESACKEAAPTPPVEREGFGVQEVQLELTGLSPSTTYHFRVIAENSFAHGAQRVISEEHTLTTQSSPVEAKLLDGRGWELVTPPEKDGSTIYALRKEGGLIQAAANGDSIAYVAAGPVGESAPSGSRSPEPTEIVAKREAGATGAKDPWSSQDVATETEAPSEGFEAGGPWEYQAFSSSLSASIVAPLTESALNAGEPEEAPAGQDIYVRGSEECPEGAKSTPCFVPLVTPADDTGSSHEPLSLTAASLGFATATPDLEHVVFSSKAALTANAVPGHQALYMWTAGKPASERLQLLSVLPVTGAEEVAREVFVGGRTSAKGEGGERMAETAISQEGSSVRVVWHAGPHLYDTIVSQAAGATSVSSEQVDELDTTELGSTSPEPLFQTGSADGSTVFFTDPQHLLDGAASKGQNVTELYAFEPAKPAGKRVTNLTPALTRGEAADVVGGVLGASDSGSTVYFVANGVLSANEGTDGEHARQGDCFVEAPRSHGCNLYVVHRNEAGRWESPRFIVRLSMEDAPDWGAPHPTVLGYSLHLQSSRVSPNGEYLAFMSDRHLLGYDNDDANSGFADEEVYLYHFAQGSLVCASCNPSGAQPVGVEDVQNGGEGEGLAVDRPEAWGNLVAYADHWLAGNIPGWTSYGLLPSVYQSRYLSNQGRLFFNSADALVPVAKPTRKETVEVDGVLKEAEVGVENVYEYEPGGEGTCDAESENAKEGCVQLISSGESEHESSFLDASEDGSNVFFLTDARLTAWDVDSSLDVYDARICKPTEAESDPEPCAPPPSAKQPPCTAEECRPPATPPPVLLGSASNVSSGSANLNSASANLAPRQQVLGATTSKKHATRAQLLASALKACKKDKRKGKRVACERAARKKYGSKKRSSSKGEKADVGHRKSTASRSSSGG
jgi:hypothetical protein